MLWMIIAGILCTIAGILFVLFYYQIRDNRESYQFVSDRSPMWTWNFWKRWLPEYAIGLGFVLCTLGPSLIIVFIQFF